MRKSNNEYLFSVEGETEKLYLEWLQDIVNESDPKRTLTIKVKVNKDPLSYSKRVINVDKPIYHLCDMEGTDEESCKIFKSMIDELSEAKKKLPNYRLGYSNFSFELWMLLHKTDLYSSLSSKEQYIRYLKKEYHLGNNIGLSDYKKEKTFKFCLNQLSLSDVKKAIERAEHIMNERENTGKPIEYKRVKYYSANPSLSIHEVIKQILEECLAG